MKGYRGEGYAPTTRCVDRQHGRIHWGVFLFERHAMIGLQDSLETMCLSLVMSSMDQNWKLPGPCMLLLLFGVLAGPVPHAQMWWEPPEKGKGPVDELRVDAAITLGVEHIKSKQKKNGSFPGHEGSFPMGMTALCLLTLVKSGVQPSDPAISRALDHLRYMPFRKTYSTGCMLMALEAIHPPNCKEWAEAGVKFLLETRQVKRGGTWGYPDNDWEKTGTLGRPDLSNTQYAILGLRSARRLGVKVPPAAFTDVVEFLVDDQLEKGAFRYEGAHRGSGSMITAGLGIITIAEEVVGKTGTYARIRGEARAAFKRGMNWFKKNYCIEWNPYGDLGARNKQWMAYYLYGIERFCDIRGMSRVGEHDWYKEGARFLLANQGHEGNWGCLEDTCFALLFLSRSHLSVSREIRTEAVEKWRDALERRRAVREARLKPPDPNHVPYVRSWLVLGPFRVKDQNALDLRNHPRPGKKPNRGLVTLKKRWHLYESPTDSVDLEKFLGGGDRRLAYVATHFHVPAEEEVLLWLGTRDAWRVWVNGKEIQSRMVNAMNGKDRWRIPCMFKRGTNTIIALLEDDGYEWTFHFRISDPEGFAVPGLLNSPSFLKLRKMVKQQ